MFVRPCWKPQSEDEIYDFIDQNPWGLLVNNAEHGPYATNLPLLLDRSRKGKGVLVGHIARANAHAAVLGSGSAPALAVFQGPYSCRPLTITPQSTVMVLCAFRTSTSCIDGWRFSPREWSHSSRMAGRPVKSKSRPSREDSRLSSDLKLKSSAWKVSSNSGRMSRS